MYNFVQDPEHDYDVNVLVHSIDQVNVLLGNNGQGSSNNNSSSIMNGLDDNLHFLDNLK